MSAASLQDLIHRYDLFLVDQFGVLHNGSVPYPGAVAALGALKAAGKAVIILSNSGKRSEPNVGRIVSLGFRAAHFDHVLTSGEVAWHMLKSEMIGTTIPAGARCLLLARDNDRSAIDGLELSDAADGQDADVILLCGSRGDEIEMADYAALLTPAATRNVPCLCTNPDKIMLTSRGPRFGAGAIADTYGKLGGPVIRIGKPFPDIYRTALLLAGSPEPARVCCIGDSVEHDIAGGRNAGFATALVRSGILAAHADTELEQIYNEFDATPDHILDQFALDAGAA